MSVSNLSFPKKYKKFLDYALEYSEANGKKVEVRDVYHLSTKGGKCAGYCDEGGMVVAGKNPEALHTFVHEFSHVCQMVENSPLWARSADYVNYLYPNFVGKHVFKEGVGSFECFYEAMKLERDCEKRALKFVGEFDLPIEPSSYIRQANVCLFYYHYVFLKKKWPGPPKVCCDKLFNSMPDKLVSLKRLRKIDMDMMEMFDKFLS